MKKFVFLFGLFACFSSCTKDTCNSILGDTFLTIELPIVSQDSIGNITLKCDMVTLNDLTEAYFNATTIITNEKDRFGNEWKNDHSLVAESEFSKDNFTIQFNEFDIVSFGEVELHFRLRDRKDFIDCNHGGSEDSYFLKIRFTLKENEEQILELESFTWAEEFSAGPF